MKRTWDFDLDQMIHISGDDWLEYGRFGADTYGLHTVFGGREVIIRIDAESSKDATEEATSLLDKIAEGWRASNWGYTITEAAEILGVSRQRVHKMLQDGKLEGYKRGNSWFVYYYSVEKRKGK